MFKKKAKKSVKELNDYYKDIIKEFKELSDFQRGYIYGIKVAIIVISRIFKL